MTKREPCSNVDTGNCHSNGCKPKTSKYRHSKSHLAHRQMQHNANTPGVLTQGLQEQTYSQGLVAETNAMTNFHNGGITVGMRTNNFNPRPWTPTVQNNYAFPPFYSENSNISSNTHNNEKNGLTQYEKDTLLKELPPRLVMVSNHYKNTNKVNAANNTFKYQLPFPSTNRNVSLHIESNQNIGNHSNSSTTTSSSDSLSTGTAGSILKNITENLYSNEHHQGFYRKNNHQHEAYAFMDNIYSSSKYIFRCNVCGKYFKRKSWLKRHLLSHSTNRQYSCPWCLSKHKRKDNLLQHMKLKHTQQVLMELQKLNETSLQLHDQSHISINTASIDMNGQTLLAIKDGGKNGHDDNASIITMVDNGTLKKEDVKKALNLIIERQRYDTDDSIP